MHPDFPKGPPPAADEPFTPIHECDHYWIHLPCALTPDDWEPCQITTCSDNGLMVNLLGSSRDFQLRELVNNHGEIKLRPMKLHNGKPADNLHEDTYVDDDGNRQRR